MSAGRLRVQLTPAFVLHQRPFRDTSLIVEVYARDHGRLTTFARGARGPRGGRRNGGGRFNGLQGFQRLLLSWHGRGEAPQLIAAEPDGYTLPFPSAQWLSACYLNELLLKLTPQHDPQPLLFGLYEQTLHDLANCTAPEAVLRLFEKQLLDLLGFGIDFTAEADSGLPVQADRSYRFHPGSGVSRCEESRDQAFNGRTLLAMAAGELLRDEADLREARTLMRLGLDHCLEGRELRTRTVARSVARMQRGVAATASAVTAAEAQPA